MATETVNVVLDDFTGDTGTGGTRGLVPAPAAGDAAAGKFLSAGGSFDVPDHNSLGGVQGGATGEYYHLTIDQISNVESLQSAAFEPTSSFDPAGSAAAAQSAAATDATTKANAAETNAKTYADGLVVGLFDDRGNWDASGNLWPATGGSGAAGAVLKGDVWRVSVAGTLGGELADVGDSFRALVNTPGQTASNWALFAANTQQATESVRGTAAIATQAEAEDSASTNDIDIVTPKKWWQAFVAGLNTTRLGSVIHAATSKATPVDNDELPLVDSEASNVLKKLTWANLKATLKTYFDTLYSPAKLRATLAADFTTSSATFVDVPGLAVTVPANSTYILDFIGNTQSTQLTNGFAVSATITGSPTVRTLRREMYSTATAPAYQTINVDDGGSVAVTTTDAINVNRPIRMDGIIKTAGSAAVVQIRLIRTGAASNNVQMTEGSTLIATPI